MAEDYIGKFLVYIQMSGNFIMSRLDMGGVVVDPGSVVDSDGTSAKKQRT